MKLEPVLIDERYHFGRPSYGFPWSRLGDRPRIQVPYQRFHNIPDDFWEPVSRHYDNNHQDNPDDFWEPVSRHDNNHQDNPHCFGRLIPISVDRNSGNSSRHQRKYEYIGGDDDDEQLNLACKLSLANQNNNGNDVRRRRNDSGSRTPNSPVSPSTSDTFQQNLDHEVIKIEDDEYDPPPVPPPRTTSLLPEPERRSNRPYVEASKRDNWKLSDDSDSEITISLVPVKPKINRTAVEKNNDMSSKYFYLGSSDDSESDDTHLDSQKQRYGYYQGMEKQDKEFNKLMQKESGGEKCSVEGKSVLQRHDVKQSSVKEISDCITPVPSYPAYNVIRQIISREGRQVDYIHGDGNCFFRALSKVIYSSESCHEEIRQAVVDIMEKYPKEFEQFIDSSSIHEHIVCMRKLGTWGTQAEIYGAATLLQRDVYILSPDHTGENYRWLLFSPRFAYNENETYDNCYLTLCHTNGNHYDRIAPLHGNCNCHLIKPRLSGVRARIDLTDDIV